MIAVSEKNIEWSDSLSFDKQELNPVFWQRILNRDSLDHSPSLSLTYLGAHLIRRDTSRLVITALLEAWDKDCGKAEVSRVIDAIFSTEVKRQYLVKSTDWTATADKFELIGIIAEFLFVHVDPVMVRDLILAINMRCFKSPLDQDDVLYIIESKAQQEYWRRGRRVGGS